VKQPLTGIVEARTALQRELQRLTREAFATGFSFSLDMPSSPMQYWTFELSLVCGESDAMHKVPCGCFTGEGRFQNKDLGIDTFFSNNDDVVEHFYASAEAGRLDPLGPLIVDVQKALSPSGASAGGVSAWVGVYSALRCEDGWRRGLCEECLLIISANEGDPPTVVVDCMMSERYFVKVPSASGAAFFSVPYDKMRWLDGAERVEGYLQEPRYPYQVALSFAGEDRPYVAGVARLLRNRGLRVFYDDYERASLWGKDLYVHLDDIYRNKARFCILFLSKAYREKVWTNHERSSAQARAFEERAEYILPVRLDDTEIPGLKPTIGYVSAAEVTASELADMVFQKVYGIPPQPE
jgi:hypothetical protein